MRSSRVLYTGMAILGLAASVVTLAQTPSDFKVVASGLNAPRGLTFGPDGSLYVASGGTGGTNATTASQCLQVPGPVGPYTGGSTGTVVKIDTAGKVSTVASGFPSTQAATGDLSSVADVTFLNGTLYALITGGGCSHGNPASPNGIAKIDLNSGKWTVISNLSQFALAHPGKYDNAGDFEPDGTWFSMVAYDNQLLTVEPNRGIVAGTATPSGPTYEVIDISASQGHIVPTGMTVKDGSLYVGNLYFFPVLPQWSRVLRVSLLGEINDDSLPGFQHAQPAYVADSKAGFTTIMALNTGPDGLLYALELSDMAGFPAPGLGKVVRVDHSGKIEEVITGLNIPGGMTWGPDHALYVSDFSAVPAPTVGIGRVLRFSVPYGY